MICRVLPSGSLGGDARHLRDLSSVVLDEDGAAIGVGERSVITHRCNTSRLERASRKRPRTTPSRTGTTPPPSSFVTTTTTTVSPEAHA
jgi:hypothetical protein